MATIAKTSLIILLLVTFPLLAKDQPFIDEPDPIYKGMEEKAWEEGEVALPGDFKEENLQEFQLNGRANSPFRYFIDRGTLQTDEDGVTRFLIVIRSASGALNSSYEGIRCGEREYKIYAYGSKEGLQSLHNPAWRRIQKTGRGNYQNALYNDLICDLNKGSPNPPEAVFRAMRIGKAVDNSPFTQD